MVFLSFSFPSLAENVLSAAGKTISLCILTKLLKLICLGNHTFASVKGPEDYNFLKASFEPVWKELGDLIADPFVYVKGKEYQHDIVCGSDYKVCVWILKIT